MTSSHLPRQLLGRSSRILLLVSLLCGTHAAGAAGQTGGADLDSALTASSDAAPVTMAPVRHVRPVGRNAATLLDRAMRLSPTVAALVEAIDDSDLFVYVQTGPLKVKALLRFAAATPHARFIRISINTPELECRMIGELAHELQHALEIAGASEVRDEATLRQFYEIEGLRTPEGGYCTLEARRIGALAIYEVTSGAGLRAR